MGALESGQASDYYYCVRLTQGFVSESQKRSAIPVDDSQFLRTGWVSDSGKKSDL